MNKGKVAALLLLLAMTVTACGKDSENNEQDYTYTDKQNTSVDTNVDETDTENTEESSTSNLKYWINTVEFGEQKDDCELKLFNMQNITYPINLLDFDNYCNGYSCYITSTGEDSFEGKVNSMEEFFAKAKTISSESHIYLDDDDTTIDIDKISLYDFKEEPISVQQCVDNGWWSVYASDYGHNINISQNFGFPKDTDEYELIEGILEKTGAPDYLITTSICDDAYTKNDGLFDYDLVFDYEEYVIQINIVEYISGDASDFHIAGVGYYPKEYWDHELKGQYEESAFYIMYDLTSK